MRWAAAIVLVLAVVGAALYAVGVFLLPNGVDVTRTITIERPRATVFAQVNDLKIVRQWSPFNARDPSADYTFSSDPPGEGQSMSWSGNDRQVGHGELSILRSEPLTRVHSLLRIGRRSTFDSVITLARQEAPQGARTRVEWRVTASCRGGWINVPCRYANLMLQRQITRDLDQGLIELKEMSEDPRMPTADFEGFTPEFMTLPPEPFLFVLARVGKTVSGQQGELNPRDVVAQRVQEAMRDGRRRVEDAMTRYNLIRTGALVRVTVEDNSERYVFRIGYPFEGPAPLALIAEDIGETPSGRVMRAVHDGPLSALPETYAQAVAYLRAHQIEQRGPPWEVVLEDGDTANTPVRIQIYFPIQ
jgi:effector-binding domain-containing protein